MKGLHRDEAVGDQDRGVKEVGKAKRTSNVGNMWRG